jgi:hypothetical protein
LYAKRFRAIISKVKFGGNAALLRATCSSLKYRSEIRKTRSLIIYVRIILKRILKRDPEIVGDWIPVVQYRAQQRVF